MPTPNVISVIMGGGRGTRLHPLTKDRCKPAVPLAGKYRLVDIPISNCLNAGYNRIFVLSQFNTASLHKHIQQTYKFDQFGQGFVDILAAEQTMDKEGWYQGTADAVRQNLHHFGLNDDSLVIILSGDQLYRMDLDDMVRQHRETGADVTIAAKAMPKGEVSALGVMRVRNDLTVSEFVEKPKDPGVIASLVIGDGLRERIADRTDTQYCLASMGIYVFTGRVLIESLANGMTDFGKEVIPSLLNGRKLCAYVFDGYWEDIGTVGSFWECNLSLTDTLPPFDFFDSDRPIYTNPTTLPAAKINSAVATGVSLSDGCILTACTLNRCSLGVRSVVRENARMENVVMLGADHFEAEADFKENLRRGRPHIGVGAGSVIKNAIVDKNARIGANVRLTPFGIEEKHETASIFVRDGVLVVKKGAIIPDNTQIGAEAP